MYKIRSFCAIFAVVGFTHLQAQELYTMYKKAEETLYKENFAEALDLYEKIEKVDSVYEDIQYKIEVCSLLSNRKYTDMDVFDKYQAQMAKRDKFYYYWKGRVLMQHYKFEEALESLKTFVTLPAKKSNEIKRESNRWSNWARTAKKYMDNPEFNEVYLLDKGVNTEKAELSPIYFEDKRELLFLSNQDDTNPDLFQVYHTKQNEDQNWSKPSIINDLGTFTRDNSNIEMSKDGKLFYFRSGKKSGLYSNQQGENLTDWSGIEEFDSKISSKKISSQFLFNKREDRVIFSRNVGSKKKPNFDLFQSFKNPKTDNWSNPKIMSIVINSEYNEKNPYLSPDEKILYFSSDGHETMGGYDIFKTEFDSVTSTWSESMNMGFPINSPDDEIDFKLDRDQKSGTFTSNRLNTYGDNDIFFFKEIPFTVKIKGRVVDRTTWEPVTDASIFFRPVGYTDFYFFSPVDEKGQYSMEINSDSKYEVKIKKKGEKSFVLDDFEIRIIKKIDSIITKDFYFGEKTSLQPSVIETKIQNLGEIDNPSDRVILPNIYFDFASSEVKDESLSLLNTILKKMNQSSQLKIEISGHTDNIGGNKYNQILSQKRADIIMNWLIENGISKDRLIAKGYGETNPIVSNDDEIEGRVVNRRIEIIVR